MGRGDGGRQAKCITRDNEPARVHDCASALTRNPLSSPRVVLTRRTAAAALPYIKQPFT